MIEDVRPRGLKFCDDALIYDPCVILNPHVVSIGRGTRIDSFTKLEGGQELVIGEYVHIASFAHLGIGGGALYIGDYAAVASGGKVISGSNLPTAPSMSAVAPSYLQRTQHGLTVLGRYACVLTHAVVLPGVHLWEGAVLAAGGVATRDIPEWEIWGGVPARFLARRVLEDAYARPMGVTGDGRIVYAAPGTSRASTAEMEVP